MKVTFLHHCKSNYQMKRTRVTLSRFPLILIFFTLSCEVTESDKTNHHAVKDAVGRNVLVPDTIMSVIGLRPGALRLLSYMDVTNKIEYVEGNEKIRSTPYILANARLTELDIIGTGNNFDYELLTASNTDLIVTTYMNGEEADKLQKIIRKPVFVLKYGNLDDEIDDFFNSLSLLGDIFHREGRADTIIQYIKTTIDDFRSRTTDHNISPVTAYIGGVAQSGSHGLTSTAPSYPPFRILSVRNAAESLDSVMFSFGINQENAFIEKEQLIKWNPDFLFLDASGIMIWEDELDKPLINRTLKAIPNARVYTVLPYNWYTINFENILCNAWFIGKTIYPEAFSDISVEKKCSEIYRFFLGSDVYDKIKSLYNPYIQFK